MSTPISSCMQMKSIVDEDTYKQLFEIYKSNHIYGGHYTIFPCCCDIPCNEKYKITPKMIEEHNERLAKDWEIFIKGLSDKDKHKIDMYRGVLGQTGYNNN